MKIFFMLEGANDYSILTFVAIGTALFFDFVNGFHDSANAIATVVGTRVLKPLHAVIIAAFANFVGPFLFGTAIATTVGNGIIEPEFSTVDIILAGLIGAIIWDLVTWYLGLPSSSSHALIGGLVGSALIVGGWNAIIVPGVEKVMIFMILSPVAGFVIAFVLAMIIIYFLKDSKPLFINRVFGKLQIVSSTFFSLTHGANDGQKTMGVITALLMAGGFMSSDEFVVPAWVIVSAAAAISAGTLLGGWRIVKTMAFRITELKPYQGFCAETGGGVILTAMAGLGIPVSTTQAISGAIMGVGSTRRLSAVRWGIGRRIVYAWLITIPASAAIASIVTIFIQGIFS